MAAFKKLRDVCHDFEQELQQISSGLFSAKIEETFEDLVAKKTADLSILTAKSRLLGAKPLSLLPQITSQDLDEDGTLITYGDTVTQKLIERHIVLSTAQSHAVKSLLTAPDHTLDPELLERKRKILTALSEYATVESTLLTVQSLLREKEDALADVRERWHDKLGQLRDIREQATGKDALNTEGRYYQKLQNSINRMEQMRWLIPKLVTSRTRGGYDWLEDPHQRLRALKLARKPCGVDVFVTKDT